MTWSILLAAIAGMVIGFFWYSPTGFGKQWMKEMKIDPKKAKKEGMMKGMIGGFIGTLVMAYILSIFIGMKALVDASVGATIGITVWVGFVATVALNSILWEGKSLNYYLITVGHYLCVLIVMGAIIGGMA